MDKRESFKQLEMRRKIIAGNWKMNLSLEEGERLVEKIKPLEGSSTYIFPPSLYLSKLNDKLKGSNISVGSQNAHFESKGAFTGEISMEQLKSCNIETVLIGHSERRNVFHETDEMLKQKVDAALRNNLEIFFCCGEPLDIREKQEHLNFIKNQLEVALKDVKESDFDKIVIAYEPVWAIGTGKTASPEQAEEVHAFIRSFIESKWSKSTADSLSILYGGSCKPNNAAGLFTKPNIDGGLIGGASLNSADFNAIIDAI